MRLIYPQAQIYSQLSICCRLIWPFCFPSRSALCSALVRPGLCTVEQLATTSKLGGNSKAAKQFLFLGTAVTKLQLLVLLTPPEQSYQTRLEVTVREHCASVLYVYLGCVCARLSVCVHMCGRKEALHEGMKEAAKMSSERRWAIKFDPLH